MGLGLPRLSDFVHVDCHCLHSGNVLSHKTARQPRAPYCAARSLGTGDARARSRFAELLVCAVLLLVANMALY